jgi:hypothetical protein
MGRARGALTAAVLILLHHLLAMTHLVPPDRELTIRRERREQRIEHLPEHAISATQPQVPVVEQAPPVLPGLTDGAGWMTTLNNLVPRLFQRRRPVLPLSDDWGPYPSR